MDIRTKLAVVLLAAAVLLGLVSSRSASAASVVVDAASGAVLSAEAPNHLWYPASLTKLMTVYVALAEIRAGRLSLADRLTVSARAASVPPVRFGLEAGETITVRQAIDVAIVASGNDAALALAEKIGGSEEKFANAMTTMAQSLGMTRTLFRNATGLPDEAQVTTARDMALLALALIKDYPQYYPLFNQRKVAIGKRSRGTVNALLGSYKGADGFKTGFTCGSGYNLVASATRGGRRVIGVVLGSTSRDQRTSQMTMLLDAGFAVAPAQDVALTETVLADADAGAPPTVISDRTCATHGDGESAVMAAARAGAWGIVFGSFADKKKAAAVLADASRQLGPLAGAKATIAPRSYNGVKQWTAMIVGISQGAAGKACKKLWARNAYCLALRPEVLGNKAMAWR
jgi:D-alanyl-D-alanine carboxypeptidase